MNERKLFQNGITLIALVISIIVMLILAGVSLNATIGDNGIITQAQNATYMQSIAALEEYLQTEYVKYYDETENYTSKIELLSSKLGNLCLKDGTKNYITYDGKMYYLINKQTLPDEVKNQLKGGDTTEYLKYIRLQDVYGVTPDLKVYYCESGTDNALGTLDSTELDPNTPLKKINQDVEMKSAITEALASVGVTVGEDGVTVGDASKLKNIELDGSKHNITSISGLSELSSLKTVTLSNLNLNDLDGLQNCTLLYYVYFKNCKVNDYSKLSTVLDLQYLYLYLPPSMSESDANAQVNNLGNGLANATELNKLEYFGISGTIDMFEGEYSVDIGASYNKWDYRSDKLSNVTSIKNLEKFSNNIKKSIKYVFLNNNSFNSIDCLREFTNIYELDLMWNKNLINLCGLENHENLFYVFSQFCNLNDISALQGCTKINKLALRNNSNLKSLNGLEDSKNIDLIYVSDCNISDIKALNNNIKLRFLNIANNINLESIIALKNCTGLRKLYLLGNEKMIGTEVRDALADPDTHILQNCGGNYTIPSKYNIYFSTLTSYDYSNLNLTDESEEINALKNKTNVTRLKLNGNPNLSNSKLQEILSTMTGLKALSLNGCENLNSIDFISSGKVTKLLELDLRNTNSSLTDLSNLNDYAIDLKTLIINNSKTDISKIVKTINRLADNYEKNLYKDVEESWISSKYYNARSFVITGDVSKYSFKNCNDLNKLIMKVQSFTEEIKGTLDLSECENLVKFEYGAQGGCNLNVILPNSISELIYETDGICKVAENTNFNSVELRYSANSFMKDLPESVNIKSLTINGREGIELENLNKLANKSSFEKLKLYSSIYLGNEMKLSGFEKLQGIFYAKNVEIDCVSKISKELFEHFPYIENLKILNSSNVISIEGIENCIKLKQLESVNCSISSLQEITNLENLNLLKIMSNKVSDIITISNLKKLENLDLSNNNINNLVYLENLIENGRTNLQYLNLEDNIIQTTTLNGHNNVETLKKLYNAGLRTLDISGNNFTAGTTDELKSLKWTSYKE